MVDQGLGAWRAAGAPRHNFHADPARQARALASTKFAVHVETGRDAPIVLAERPPS